MRWDSRSRCFFSLLAKLSVEKWHGGNIQRIRPSVIHLMRGQVYDIKGKKFFAMSGASSHDISGGILKPDNPKFRQKRKQLEISGALYRINHRSWRAAELPNVQRSNCQGQSGGQWLANRLYHHPLLPHLGTK